MKIRNSLKSLKNRHRDCRVIRRRGRTYVINKTNRRFKARQGGLAPRRCAADDGEVNGPASRVEARAASVSEDGMVEAVVFDVGRVLFQWQLRALFERLVDDPVELEFVLGEVITEQWHFEHDAGRPLAEMVPERKALFPEHAPLIEAYATRFNETIPGPVPGSLAIVRALHARGLPLYAITNFGAEFWDGFRPTQAVFDLFGAIVVSGKERLVKPDPAIFALAAERFGHPPGEMLFVDDNRANIDGARACGWQVHHFIDAQTLRADLEGRGLLS